MPNTIEIIKAIKDYGSISICVVGLVWFNNRSDMQDQKIERIEQRLYDCFEDRIKETRELICLVEKLQRLIKFTLYFQKDSKLKQYE